MKHNIGKTDKTIRIIAGLVIMAAGLYFKSWWGALGVIPIVTAFIRFCPFYCPLKVNTDKTEK